MHVEEPTPIPNFKPMNDLGLTRVAVNRHFIIPLIKKQGWDALQNPTKMKRMLGYEPVHVAYIGLNTRAEQMKRHCAQRLEYLQTAFILKAANIICDASPRNLITAHS